MCFLPSDATQCDLFPQTASCKCYFFDNLGKLSSTRLGDGSDRRFNDVLRRRFLRQGNIIEIIIRVIIVMIDHSIYVRLVFEIWFVQCDSRNGGEKLLDHFSDVILQVLTSIVNNLIYCSSSLRVRNSNCFYACSK
jgi:hypothetical protein